MNAYALTDVGRQRNMNQDYVFSTVKPVGNLPNLFIVADGMGGHKAGDLASKFSVNTFIDCVKNSVSSKPVQIMSDAINHTNEELLKLASTSEDYRGMGTTFVVAVIYGRSMYVANIGDSRLYLADRELKQVTRDHSLVEEMVTRGALDRNAARYHEQKNMITRAIGGDTTVLPDFFPIDIKPGNRVLMCSDGLTNMVEDNVIERILKTTADIDEAATKLVELANENGGRDNVSVIIIEY